MQDVHLYGSEPYFHTGYAAKIDQISRHSHQVFKLSHGNFSGTYNKKTVY